MGTVYLPESVESDRIMVDLASLGLATTRELPCRFSLSEECEAVAPLLGRRNPSTGPSPVERHPALKHRGLEVATHEVAAYGSNATRIGLPLGHAVLPTDTTQEVSRPVGTCCNRLGVVGSSLKVVKFFMQHQSMLHDVELV